MDRMKTKLIIAVTTRLSAAQDSDAKAELIEELSENLYQRYLDLAASGMEEEQAYAAALEDLGDVDELLEYLRSLGPDGQLPRQEESSYRDQVKEFADDFGHNLEEILRETISQTKDAVDQAKIIVKDVAKKLKEKYPNGFSAELHFNKNDASRSGAQDAEQEQAEEKDVVYGFGYDKKKGGFFTQWGEDRGQCVNETVFPAQQLKGIDIQVTNGDVTVCSAPAECGEVSLAGDTDQLEVRISDSGVLTVRQGKTASSNFFFGRGLASSDVELTLPDQFWDFIRIATINGDIRMDGQLRCQSVSAKTTNGDIDCAGVVCPQTVLKSISGDIDWRDSSGSIQAETMSGDITAAGTPENADLSSMSGDIHLSAAIAPMAMELRSKSGDCTALIPGDQGFTLHFETISGQLKTTFALVGPMGSKHGEAIYLDGGQRRYTMASVSGDIALKQQ